MTDDIMTRPCCDVRPCGCADARMVIDHLHAEIERLRECLRHAIDHVGKWQLFTAEEKQTILSEYEKAVRVE
jgi:hypothetical protein